MNIKDYNGKPSRFFDISRCANSFVYVLKICNICKTFECWVDVERQAKEATACAFKIYKRSSDHKRCLHQMFYMSQIINKLATFWKNLCYTYYLFQIRYEAFFWMMFFKMEVCISDFCTKVSTFMLYWVSHLLIS